MIIVKFVQSGLVGLIPSFVQARVIFDHGSEQRLSSLRIKLQNLGLTTSIHVVPHVGVDVRLLLKSFENLLFFTKWVAKSSVL